MIDDAHREPDGVGRKQNTESCNGSGEGVVHFGIVAPKSGAIAVIPTSVALPAEHARLATGRRSCGSVIQTASTSPFGGHATTGKMSGMSGEHKRRWRLFSARRAAGVGLIAFGVLVLPALIPVRVPQRGNPVAGLIAIVLFVAGTVLICTGNPNRRRE
jgi:hypothetical protein